MSVLQNLGRSALCITQGYLLGSLNTGIILSKSLYHRDIRNEGSGNAGATNMARTFGWESGLAVLLGDMLKTEVAVAIGRKLVPGVKGLVLSGLSCLVGHCRPAFYQHRGGKGVSVGAALALILDLKVFGSGILTFLMGALTSHKVSVGSIAAAASLPVSAALAKKKHPVPCVHRVHCCHYFVSAPGQYPAPAEKRRAGFSLRVRGGKHLLKISL